MELVCGLVSNSSIEALADAQRMFNKGYSRDERQHHLQKLLCKCLTDRLVISPQTLYSSVARCEVQFVRGLTVALSELARPYASVGLTFAFARTWGLFQPRRRSTGKTLQSREWAEGALTSAGIVRRDARTNRSIISLVRWFVLDTWRTGMRCMKIDPR